VAGDTIITVVGNITNDPELRFTSSGVGVASFTVASTPRTRYATAKVSKVERSGGGQESRTGWTDTAGNDDPWTNPGRGPDARYGPPGGFHDEPPF
jgi:hypothetical protein